ncbi:hypothetical protein INQ45_09425 [Flavobacterium columnare]|uniref:hypothetical protein n=1 Tax=Flavobacterium columnare TaxID=996 RepID=UPI002D205719|nr:hypothetical protein [Flavobacterium columnare]MEB3801264.1 hypothetical protein [Flavobacterium columnare]
MSNLNTIMDPITLLKLMLPDFLVDYFEIISVDNSEENLHLYFEELRSLDNFISLKYCKY